MWIYICVIWFGVWCDMAWSVMWYDAVWFVVMWCDMVWWVKPCAVLCCAVVCCGMLCAVWCGMLCWVCCAECAVVSCGVLLSKNMTRPMSNYCTINYVIAMFNVISKKIPSNTALIMWKLWNRISWPFYLDITEKNINFSIALHIDDFYNQEDYMNTLI